MVAIRMKESWLYYDYLRRWWGLLLLGSVLGSLAGLVYYSNQVHPIEYAVTAMVAVENPKSTDEHPPTVLISLNSGFHPTVEQSTAVVESSVTKLVAYTTTPAVTRELLIDQRGISEPWWKTVVFMSVIGVLLAIGGIYLWEDAQAYRRHRNQLAPGGRQLSA